MTEEFLHYLWRFRKFQQLALNTENGEPVSIIQTGIHNHDSGPDFSEAKIQIGEQLWAGNVEIHVSSSDWYKHGHTGDKAYHNVILHVVYEDDKPVADKNGQPIPTLVLKGLFDEQLYWNYERLVQTQEVIPCAAQFPAVDDMIKESMLERALVERLEMKANAIQDLWEQNNRNWNETFYQWMARGFGLKVNAEPMLMLARALPQSILAKHKDNLFQLEALLFGTAGMLMDSEEDYAKELNKEFQFLKSKYGLEEMDVSIWKFARLRPPSFPTVRIGQFAALIHRSENLFSKVLGIGSLKVLEQLLSDSPSIYWREHYRFGSEHNRTKAGMGKAFQETLVINVVVPFLFIYGKMKEENFYCQRAMDLLDQMGGEDNKITRIYKNLDLEMDTAFRSQAAIQLNQRYCSLKKCLNCSIGIHLIR
ncbi:DUF2851 family protein [Owenweeksia hongkongensis]|uniref:DUF2851 family protein n=1 Tax=Owenweeksia hongkongensis TaxID=253245 RepID=UPI003A925A15